MEGLWSGRCQRWIPVGRPEVYTWRKLLSPSPAPRPASRSRDASVGNRVTQAPRTCRPCLVPSPRLWCRRDFPGGSRGLLACF